MESHRIILSILVIGAIVAVLINNKPTITGYVPTTVYLQELNISVSESQRFILTPKNSETLSSLSVSGAISGNGLASIYLSDGKNELLVYSNKKKQTPSIEHITGLAASDLIIQPGQKLDRIDSLPDQYTAEPGGFTNQCLETCMIAQNTFTNQNLYLDIIVEPGTQLNLSQLLFTANG